MNVGIHILSVQKKNYDAWYFCQKDKQIIIAMIIYNTSKKYYIKILKSVVFFFFGDTSK